jgi:dTDP-4-amino-4,6-dideoxygalactose transaminase
MEQVSSILRCEKLLEDICGGVAFLTPSCTAAIELSCLLLIKPGDEVIMPSFTFPSAANAVILRGGVPVFVDSRMDTLNIDEERIEEAITPRTKAILPIHYAGVVADMERINQIADAHGLWVIEDAAQAIGNWKVTGHVGCLSFHDTKNVKCGEGGALIVRSPDLVERFEIARDCGTTKAKWRRGETSTWDWISVGQSALMSEHCAKVLEPQLEHLDAITQERLDVWNVYNERIDARKRSNGHIYWFLSEDRKKLKERLGDIRLSSHYEAAHLTDTGRQYGRVGGQILNTQRIAAQITRPPMNVTPSEALEISRRISTEIHGSRQAKAA